MWKEVITKMPRMKDLDIDFISLVNKGANKQTVKIYKSVDEPVNDEEFRGFFNVMKSFFAKEKKEEVKKSTYVTDFNQLIGEKVVEERIREARWALMDSLENTLLEPTITDKVGHIATQIDAFKVYVLNTVNTVGIQKSIEQIKEIKKSKEEEEVKVEDIKKMLDDALAPIKEELKVLKGEEEPKVPEVNEDGKDGGEQTEPTQEEIIAKAIEEATASLKEELTELKKSRKAPQSLTLGAEEQEIKKSYI